ncbi:single-stranded DNA-binding protein [Mycoplasma zalophidermidis]|uniref:Single-stranded DNA-binding protein n=1 Tax=Mycoplasma zalophidermidis TaxID=398174 RepID=A0ABS6DRY2_9MOLU|nr:single-stranded DNA-binding protein [Mycoplasma zalophidermidis]MBU4693681.1 single-stranded DNA-binding protein [Mycoplasma zalophidermidis]MCR8966563.1 single-stranded DNA-binding protein [Mycoplasma zalophidermidis]
MNKVLLTGRVANESFWEMNTSKANILKFSIATNEINNESEFIDVVIFQNNALNFKKYVKQGDLVEVVGTLKKNSFINSEGVKEYRLEVIGNSVIYSTKALKNKTNNYVVDEEKTNDENEKENSQEDYLEDLIIR